MNLDGSAFQQVLGVSDSGTYSYVDFDYRCVYVTRSEIYVLLLVIVDECFVDAQNARALICNGGYPPPCYKQPYLQIFSSTGPVSSFGL